MLQALMQASINGPSLHSDQCKELIPDSVQLWLKQKKRRTLPKKGASTDHHSSVSEHVERQMWVCRLKLLKLIKMKLAQMRWHFKMKLKLQQLL